jgi:hypothetical protein
MLHEVCGNQGEPLIGTHQRLHAGPFALEAFLLARRSVRSATSENPGPALRKSSKTDGRINAKQIDHAPQPAMRRADEERERVPVASDAERPLPDARRTITGRTEG